MQPSFSIGIEEEYQTVDPNTLDLRSHINAEIIAKGKRQLDERIKAEMHQSVVEVGTGVCRNMREARADIINLRRAMVQLARENGLLLCAGATHPFADWRVQDIYPDERYLKVVGAFDITQFLDGYFDEDCYFLNPPSFLPNLGDRYYLDQFRRNKWVLVTGDHDICRSPNEQFSILLNHKGIPHSLHVWNDSKHDWPYWRPMAAAYIP